MSVTVLDDIPLDETGHLAAPDSWKPELARRFAASEGIALQAEHFEVLEFLRWHWSEFGELPGMRLMVRGLRQRYGERLGDSRVLYRLFPEAPLRQACRIAGLPKPASCI